MTNLDDLRIEIDKIDKELVELFENRMEVVKKVGEWKKQNNVEIFDPEREKKVLDKVSSYLKDSSKEMELRKWFQLLMDISKREQK